MPKFKEINKKFASKGSLKSLPSPSKNINEDDSDGTSSDSNMSEGSDDISSDERTSSPIPSCSKSVVTTVPNNPINIESLLTQWDLKELLPLFQSTFYINTQVKKYIFTINNYCI